MEPFSKVHNHLTVPSLGIGINEQSIALTSKTNDLMIGWDGVGWDEMEWNGMAWDGMEWHGMAWEWNTVSFIFS